MFDGVLPAFQFFMSIVTAHCEQFNLSGLLTLQKNFYDTNIIFLPYNSFFLHKIIFKTRG